MATSTVILIFSKTFLTYQLSLFLIFPKINSANKECIWYNKKQFLIAAFFLLN